MEHIQIYLSTWRRYIAYVFLHKPTHKSMHLSYKFILREGKPKENEGSAELLILMLYNDKGIKV